MLLIKKNCIQYYEFLIEGLGFLIFLTSTQRDGINYENEMHMTSIRYLRMNADIIN